MTGHLLNIDPQSDGSNAPTDPNIAVALRAQSVAIESIAVSPENPRRGDVGVIAQSLTEQGQYKPVLVNGRTGLVLAGNHTLLAARSLGWTQIAAVFVDVDERQARKIMLMDNRSSDLADYDAELLLELLGSGEDLDGTGYDRAALDALLEDVSAGVVEDEDAIPPLKSDPVTELGDAIELGPHRLVCGDARDPAVQELVMAREKADVMWTDPPFGVQYVGRTSAALTITGDTPGQLEALLTDAFSAADGVLVPGAAVYVAHAAGALAATFMKVFIATEWTLRQTLVWVKDSMVLGRSDYHYRHEPILYGVTAGGGRRGRGTASWFGNNAQTSVFEITRPRASREHPTMKPPALIEAMIRNSAPRRGLVLDPFAGSGSTLVACHASGRTARLVEIDPNYCDVIVARFEALTGIPARRGAA